MPGSGLFPPFFAGREREFGIYETKLVRASKGTPMHLALIGDWATGKTALLKKFEDYADKDYFVYSCVASPESTKDFFSSLIRGISIKSKMKYGNSILKRLKESVEIEELKFGLFGLSAELKFKSAGEVQQSFIEYINKFWQQVKNKAGAIVLLIDDLDTIKEHTDTLLILRNSLMQLSRDGSKAMTVVAGTPKLFERMTEIHAPLVRFFEPIELKNLTEEESHSAIVTPLKEVGMRYEKEVIEKIKNLCCGQPYYLQEICFHVFDEAEKKITNNEFELGFEKAFSDIAMLLLQRKASQISKTEAKLLIHLEAKMPFSYSEILFLAKRSISESAANTALRRLKEKGILDQILVGEQKGKYYIEDALLLRFLKRQWLS